MICWQSHNRWSLCNNAGVMYQQGNCVSSDNQQAVPSMINP